MRTQSLQFSIETYKCNAFFIWSICKGNLKHAVVKCEDKLGEKQSYLYTSSCPSEDSINFM